MKRPVYVVLPVYNEAEGIENVISSMKEELSSLYNPTFIVVDDGSTDGTAGILSGKKTIQVIEHQCNKGLGVAMRTGLKAAVGQAQPSDIILTSESDGTQHPKNLLALAKLVEEGADLAVASPLGPGGFLGVPAHRRFLSQSANWLYRTCFPIGGLQDYTNLVRSFRAELLQRAFAKYGDEGLISRSGFEAVPGLLIKLRTLQPKVAEHPVTIDFTEKKKGSSMRVFRTALSSLTMIGENLYSRK